MTNFKKTQLVCLSMDLEEQGLNLLQAADLYRSDAKVAVKAGYAEVAAKLMQRATKLSKQGYECLAESRALEEEAAK